MEPLIWLLVKRLAIPLSNQKTVAKCLVMAGHPNEHLYAR